MNASTPLAASERLPVRTLFSLLLVLPAAAPALHGHARDPEPVAAAAAPLEESTPVHAVVRVDVAPVIDGVLDEAMWSGLAPIRDLRQVEPVAGAAPSERTEVRIAYDSRTLYVGLSCFDAQPELLRATQSRRDASLDPDDRVELLFDPFLDRRNAFWFQISPAGSKGDALITKNGAEFNKEWDGIWYGRARVTAEGWEAELAIPTQTLNFDPAARAWGFNVRRFIRRRNEEARWSTPEPRIRFFSVANAGTLAGFEGLEHGLGLDLKPFVVLDRSYDDPDGGDAGDTASELDAGLDAFYSITPSTKLSLSFNTDFAETEVDQRRVNLTRFPLFFPEKRDFFLEDSGSFFFGPSRQRDAIPFFSRRIGIVDGKEAPLLAAAKVTGRTDGWAFGFLDVQTDDFSESSDDGSRLSVSGQNLAVARVSRDVLEQSDVGFVLTSGDPSGEDGTATWGLDANFFTNDFLGDKNLQFSSYLQGSVSDAAGGDGEAWFATLAYPQDEVEFFVDVLSVDEGYDPALGFVPRRGIRRYRTLFEWMPRLGNGIRQMGFQLQPELVTDQDGNTESVETLLRLLQIELESGDELRLDVSSMREVLDEPFEIRSGETIAEGAYSFTRFGVTAETSDKRPLDVELQLFGGEFFDGERLDAELEASWRPGAWGAFRAEYERNDVDLPSGDFIVHVGRFRADLQFGPRVSWSNFAQWDNQSDQVGLNSRLWWILDPGSELFFVVNQGWEWDVGRGIRPEDSQIALKIGYTYRL